MEGLFALAADLIVVVHCAVVLFAVAGAAAILCGRVFRWRWVQSPFFRFIHLGLALFVACQAVAGVLCPLTLWEHRLRVLAGQSVEADMSFVARIVRALIYYNAPPWVFTVLYVGFAALMLLSLVLVPPRFGRRKGEGGSGDPDR